MYVYTVTEMPSGKPVFWSNSFLQPLAPGASTPFSLSVLTEVLGRTWFRYYDNLGFDPGYGARVVRQYEGRPYLNLSSSATLESAHAGIQPMSLRLNDYDVLIADWEKPGLFDAMRVNRRRRKLTDRFNALVNDVDEIATCAHEWQARVSKMNWGQAELLQVMEQIERVSLPSFECFLAARQQLTWAYNRLLILAQPQKPFPAGLSLINNAVSGVGDLIENQMAEQMLAMASSVEASPEILAWLKSDTIDGWESELSNQAIRDEVTAFLGRYGHRCADEGEMRHPRWQEDPTPVLKGILACAKKTAKHPLKMPANHHREKLLASVDGKQRKEVERLLESIADAYRLQSEALHAIAYIWAGTRQWVLAAAQEAMNDGRLADVDDIFFFELEEIKRMMTGEWNISAVDRIRSVAAERREDFTRHRESRVPDLLVGDLPAKSSVTGLPGSAGEVIGPLRRWDTLQPHVCNGAVVGVEQLSSGWSIVLPVAQGLITPAGTPLDPMAVAARSWHTPILMGLGERYDSLVEGAQTTIDADHLIVDQ